MTNLLTAQDLLEVHYQILSIIILKKFIKLNVNLDTMIKNVKHVELNINIWTAFSNIKTLKMIQQNQDVCVVMKNYDRKLDEKLQTPPPLLVLPQ